MIAANTGAALETHDLRTRHAGRTTFIEFHLVVAGSMTMTVAQSHAICDRLEAALGDALYGAAVTIQDEPDREAKHGAARHHRLSRVIVRFEHSAFCAASEK